MSTDVIALFEDSGAASATMDELIHNGVRLDDISVLMTEHTRGRDFQLVESTKAPEGAAAGAAIGGAVGGILAALTASALPGLGLLAAGPIVATFAGIGVGSTAGGLAGALVGRGVPEHEAKLVSDKVDRGAILLAVHSHEDRVNQLRELLASRGAREIATS